MPGDWRWSRPRCRSSCSVAPGHQSVRIGERLIIGGDVAHYASGLDDHRFPVMGHDFAAQASSADRLRALRDAGAAVLPGHDPDVLKPGPLSGGLD